MKVSVAESLASKLAVGRLADRPSTCGCRGSRPTTRTCYLRSIWAAQRFTFLGEQREPTGSRVSVTQVLGEVNGSVIGVGPLGLTSMFTSGRQLSDRKVPLPASRATSAPEKSNRV